MQFLSALCLVGLHLKFGSKGKSRLTKQKDSNTHFRRSQVRCKGRLPASEQVRQTKGTESLLGLLMGRQEIDSNASWSGKKPLMFKAILITHVLFFKKLKMWKILIQYMFTEGLLGL